MVKYWNDATESSSPIIQYILEFSKQLRKEAKTSWFTSKVKISELIHNSKKPCFNSQIKLKKRISQIIVNAW